jgi:uncharacterized protein (DUF3820 family)
MPFGKYRGQDIQDVPGDYLVWLWENVELREPLRSEVYLCLFEGLDAVVPSDKLKTTYRELAKKWHPDMGGTTEAMQAVNEFYERMTKC